MTVSEDGSFDGDTSEEILDAMVADAKQHLSEDLNDAETSVVRNFYRPIANRLAEAQENIGLVLSSTQIDNAVGYSLDLITALIGVTREPAETATGEVVFSRSDPASQDYIVQTGTEVQTDADPPLKYVTTEGVSIEGETTESNSSTFATSETSFVTKHSFDVDVTERTTVDVSAEFRTTDSAYTANLEIADATNSSVIGSTSTTSTSFTLFEPGTYDVTNLSGTISIEYRISTGNTSGTTELVNSEIIKGGETRTYAPIEGVESGGGSNVGSHTINVMPSPPAGIESVTNETDIVGGDDREGDEQLRTRAKSELAEGSRASAPALVNSVRNVEDVTSVSILINDKKETNAKGHGLPPNSSELIITGGNDQDIAQAILETKGSDATVVSGVNGQPVTDVPAELPNGQVHTLDFSRSNPVTIYIDAEIEVQAGFDLSDEIKNNIVDYIGGKTVEGFERAGDLGVTDNVLYGEIEYYIREISGVYDVTSLNIGTTDPPSGTSNISIGDIEEATVNGSTDITITETEV